MFLAIFGVSCALFFYSLAIWSERFIGYLKKWIIIVFCTGFLFDLFGTGNMYFVTTNHQIVWHSIAGYMALVIMFIHLMWALLVYFKAKHKNKHEYYFHTFSIYAWLVWLIAFISGIPW